MIQLAPLLYLIAELADGKRTNEEIAAAVSEAIKRGVSADNVRMLVDEKLRPLGVIEGPEGSKPELQKLDPMLALKFRAALVPPNVVNAITTVFKPFFFPLVVVAVLGGLVALDVWLFFFHGIAQSIRQTLNDPALLLMMLGLVVLSAAFHECGHASACSYGGAKPGAMGAGIYIVWPAFYTDVTDAYRLDKRGRLRTDLGGVYFNVIFILGTAAAYAITGFEPLLLMIPLQHLEIVHQFLPFIRLDGYYIVSDLTGVPDMFARIRPTLASLLPWARTSDRVKELKPWVRVVVTAYVLTVIPVLLFMFAMMAYNSPRIFATGYDSFVTQYHRVSQEFGAGSTFAGSFGIVQMLILLLPALGIMESARPARVRHGSRGGECISRLHVAAQSRRLSRDPTGRSRRARRSDPRVRFGARTAASAPRDAHSRDDDHKRNYRPDDDGCHLDKSVVDDEKHRHGDEPRGHHAVVHGHDRHGDASDRYDRAH
ncbi:MAG: hypothetical protein E6G50_00860 [Actinobacteria bacterium]|nr:MAG: hypothetical protein E6G50_00860 [Actinomycetota bacterium]